MHTFAQKLFLMFGLRRRTAARCTPAALQVNSRHLRKGSNPPPTGPKSMGLFTPPPRPSFRIGIEIRGQGEQYIKVIPALPRTA